MRLLLLTDTGTYDVLEVSYISYDSDMTCIVDDWGNCPLGTHPIEGLVFSETGDNGQWWNVPNIPRDECMRICREAFSTGMADLTKYGPYLSDEELTEKYVE